MRRIGLCFVALAFLALPILAQSVPACGARAMGSLPLKALEGTLGYQPLQPHERLFLGLAGLGEESPLEVRYLAGGKPYLTEVVDLAASRLPEPSMKSRTALGLGLDRERIVELLALRPDLVRQLHQLAGKKGSAIQIEVRQDGLLYETLSYRELAQRSAELRESDRVALVVQSSVSGPGDTGKDKIRSVVAADYLPSCGDCTSETPCDTECGYDPGKGGPVTCGEYGICIPECVCSVVVSEYWGAWYDYRTYATSNNACYRSNEYNYPTGALHNERADEDRRDRIRRTLVCPNCPSCSGCYYQEQVIGYQTGTSYCWFEVPFTCSNPSYMCCSKRCNVDPDIPCLSHC